MKKTKGRVLIKDIGEIALIEQLQKLLPAKSRKVVVSVGDDAAVVKGSSNDMVISTDMLVENVHFALDGFSPFQLGYKAAVASLSDLAAMAALPLYLLVSLGLPPQLEVEWIKDLYRGMLKVAKAHRVNLIGGDVTSSKVLTIDMVAVGEVKPGYLRKRSEAQVGDKILVTGKLGLSSAGLVLLLKKNSLSLTQSLARAHLFPSLRVNEAQVASKYEARAMEDISDGLATEIFHICQMSKTGAKIFLNAIPISKQLREAARVLKKDPLDFALFGGEDYELVFTAPPTKASLIKEKIYRATKTRVEEVGEIVGSKQGIVLVDNKGREVPLKSMGYQHFTPHLTLQS